MIPLYIHHDYSEIKQALVATSLPSHIYSMRAQQGGSDCLPQKYGRPIGVPAVHQPWVRWTETVTGCNEF